MKLQIRNGSYFNHHRTKNNKVILIDMTSLKTKSEYCNSDFIKEASKVFKEFSTPTNTEKKIERFMSNKFNIYIDTLYPKINYNKITYSNILAIVLLRDEGDNYKKSLSYLANALGKQHSSELVVYYSESSGLTIEQMSLLFNQYFKDYEKLNITIVDPAGIETI